jgi:Na+/melibiose symporter-like transporter
MGLIFGAMFGACWFFVFLGTWEKKDLPKPEKIPLKNWLTVFSNKAYKNFLGIFLSFQIAVDLVLALFIFYIDIVVLQYKNYEVVVGTLLVCSMLLMVLQGKIAEKKGKVFPLYIGIPIWMLSTLTFIWLGPGVSVFVLCLLAAFIAVGSSAGNLSTWSMLADIYDIDEIRTGKRQEGLYSGMTTFLRKFASGVAILLMGFGLQAMGFDQNEYSVEKTKLVELNPADFEQYLSQYMLSDVVLGIKWMFVLIPLIFLSFCLFFAIKNKVTKQRFDSVLKGIEKFKTHGNIDELNEQETLDILTVTGMKKEKLWGR